MRALSKTNKILDIALLEEKIYFPGETIKGSVIVKPKSAIKANHVTIRFSGAIFVSVKEKEVISLFQLEKTLAINEGGKAKLLEAKTHNFPFEFIVPRYLPSALDFGKEKIAKISYKLIVILDRPMMPESLCPKFEYPVSVLEYVDVTRDKYSKLATAASHKQHCDAKISVPRTGFTKGETIPVNIVVDTFKKFSRKDSLVIDLVREVKICTNKNTFNEEQVLKSTKFDLNIIGPYNFTQSITSNLLIKNTPPTIKYKDDVLHVLYKVRAQLFMDSKPTPTCTLEIPITVGTWPRADVPIDDDDDDDIIQTMGEIMISDDEDDEDSYPNNQEQLNHKRESIVSQYNVNNQKVLRRTGSSNSITSINSWRSNPNSAITDATSLSLNVNINNIIPERSISKSRNTLSPIPHHPMPVNGYFNRSSSTPDLLTDSSSQPMSTSPQHFYPPPSKATSARTTRFIDPLTSYYETTLQQPSPMNSPHGSHYSASSSPGGSSGGGRFNSSGSYHRPSKPIHSSFSGTNHSNSAYNSSNSSSSNNSSLYSPYPQQHRRIGSDEFNNSNQYPSFSPTPFPQHNMDTTTMQLIHQDPDVPNHTLTMINTALVTPTTNANVPPLLVSNENNIMSFRSSDNTLDSEPDDDNDDDDDDDDLFAIIEKKKKREEKEFRRQQNLVCSMVGGR